jgi:hypothetical protein
MRDFRDSKVMAQAIRAALAAKGHKITVADSLELMAKAFGVADWNTLSAAIKTAAARPEESKPADKPFDNNHALDNLARLLGVEDWDKLRATIQAAQPPATPAGASEPLSSTEPGPRPTGRARFSAALEATLHRAVGQAAIRRHRYTTLEHLLLALIDDADAADVMRACTVDLPNLSESLASYIDDELGSLVTDDGQAPAPTAGFHRVIQRAVIHVQSSGRDTVTAANVLVAIFSERESHAAHLLQQLGLTRYDAVGFIAHGVRKDGGRAA